MYGTAHLFSQPVYLELSGHVDLIGNITMDPLPRNGQGLDSSINYKSINDIIVKNKSAITTINLLSKEAWNLVSAVYITRNDNGGPNTPFIVYYFKKE